MIIVGISGKKQSGKDTLCQYIKDNATLPVVRIGFADALKEECSKITGMPLNVLEANKARFRVLFQFWGTDFRRHFFGDDYWVVKVFAKLATLPHDCIAVIPDVRFKSEADALKRVGAVLVRVERQMEHPVKDYHTSETELDDYTGFDHKFYNNGTLAEYEQCAMDFLKILNIKQK